MAAVRGHETTQTERRSAPYVLHYRTEYDYCDALCRERSDGSKSLLKTQETGSAVNSKEGKHRTIEKRPTPVARSSPLMQTNATSNRTMSAA